MVPGIHLADHGVLDAEMRQVLRPTVQRLDVCNPVRNMVESHMVLVECAGHRAGVVGQNDGEPSAAVEERAQLLGLAVLCRDEHLQNARPARLGGRAWNGVAGPSVGGIDCRHAFDNRAATAYRRVGGIP